MKFKLNNRVFWGICLGLFLGLNVNAQKTAKKTAYESVVILPKSVWNAAEPKPFKSHYPTKITVHHEGGKVLTAQDDAKLRLKNVQTWSMGPDRNWADIPYHILIAPDGTVYEGRNALTVGETNTNYDPTGHLLISFLGNYTEQKLNPQLFDVLVRLLADACLKYGIPPEAISTHKDQTTQTSCPGEDIYGYFQRGEVLRQVKFLLSSNKK